MANITRLSDEQLAEKAQRAVDVFNAALTEAARQGAVIHLGLQYVRVPIEVKTGGAKVQIKLLTLNKINRLA